MNTAVKDINVSITSTKETCVMNKPKSSIIDLSSRLGMIRAESFLSGVAYATTRYITLGLLESSSTPTPEEIEVIIDMAEQLKQLNDDLRELGKKLDGKMDGLDTKLDARFEKLELKIDKSFDKLIEISNIISARVTTISDDVLIIQTTLDVNKSLKEKFQIPLFVALVVVAATAILRVLIP